LVRALEEQRGGFRVKLVVTGALGHIGSRFIRTLVPGAWSEVLLIDNLATQRHASLLNLPDGVPYRFAEADVLAADMERLVGGAHAVIHLAALTDPAASFADPEGVERVNETGTERVARACAAAGARLFFPSTTSVYTPSALRATDGSVDESCREEDLRPASPYAAGKLRSERRLHELGESEGLRFSVARLGTIFGTSPGMRFHTAVNRFAWRACAGLPVPVWRTALRQVRPYLDVEDAARAVNFLLARDLFGGETHNVVTVNATVEEVLAVLRALVPDLSVEYTESPAMNDLSFAVSADKLRRAGFEPAGSLERGARETVELLANAWAGGNAP
jgi:UDP-glucose 4-epimerase